MGQPLPRFPFSPAVYREDTVSALFTGDSSPHDVYPQKPMSALTICLARVCPQSVQ
jgi:hypothetical protein